MKKLLVTTAVAMLALTSCNKSNGDEDRYITKENIIGSYKMIGMEILYTGSSTDGLAIMDPCKKDDLYIFKAGEVFEYADAGTTCNSNGSTVNQWTLVSDSININGMAGKVVSLSATTMRVCTTSTALGHPVTTNLVFYRQ